VSLAARLWLSVVAAKMWCMDRRVRSRRIVNPVVAAAPSGVRTRTRLHVTEPEAAALTAVGNFLGSLYRAELAERIQCGVLNSSAQAAWRAVRKRSVTAATSSRWAGAITRAVEDQYQLGMRGVAAYVADLREAVDVLEQRCGLRPGQLANSDSAETQRRSRRFRGYRNRSERFNKTRRLAAVRARLAAAERALAAGHPSIVVGGKRLWRNRNHLDAAGVTEQEWKRQWDAARMFLTADGETGKPGGNETIRVDESGQLRIKTPVSLVNELGSHLVIEAPVRFTHRGDEWWTRVSVRAAVRYDISYDPDRDRWYLDASWTTVPGPAPSLEELRTGRILGVDLNADHLACCVLDSSGNPVGDPIKIEMLTEGFSASRRDGRVRATITALLDYAHNCGCGAVVVENLDFTDTRATGRDTLGRGQRGKRLRRVVACIPTRRFRDRLTAMAARRGIAVIGVDAAYTSKWGTQHWLTPLRQQTSDPTAVTRHHAAAVAIGRRGLGVAIRRRPARPRSGQWTALGTPPARPARHCGRGGRRGSSGPPKCPLRMVYRSTGEHPPPAANTVRAAQDSLLRTDQER
jgi:hypothetical protein